MDKIVKLTDYSDNAMTWTPKEALEDALKRIENDEEYKNYKQVLIIFQSDNPDEFSMAYVQAGFRTLECITVCEMAKSMFKRLLSLR